MKITGFKCKGCYKFGDETKSYISESDFVFIEGAPMIGKTSYFLALKGVCEVLSGEETFFDHIQEHFLKHLRDFSIDFSLNEKEWNGKAQAFRYAVTIDENGEIVYEALDEMVTPGMRKIVFERKDKHCYAFGEEMIDSISEAFRKEKGWEFKPLIGEILSKTGYSKISEAFSKKVRFIKAENLIRLTDINANSWIHKELFRDNEYTSVIAKSFEELLGIKGRKIENLATKPNFLNTISPFDFDYFTTSMLKLIILCASILDSEKNDKVYVIDDLHSMIPYEYREFIFQFTGSLHPKIIATIQKGYLDDSTSWNKKGVL
mgnify:CR=1 FL=1